MRSYATTSGVLPSAPERLWLRVMGTLNEYQARLFAAEKALELGRGGISRLSELTGMSRVTITGGVSELRGRKRLRSVDTGRVRAPGGGRKKVEDANPTLRSQLKTIVEETTAGDPMSPLKWTSKSHELWRRNSHVAGMPSAASRWAGAWWRWDTRCREM